MLKISIESLQGFFDNFGSVENSEAKSLDDLSKMIFLPDEADNLRKQIMSSLIYQAIHFVFSNGKSFDILHYLILLILDTINSEIFSIDCENSNIKEKVEICQFSF